MRYLMLTLILLSASIASAANLRELCEARVRRSTVAKQQHQKFCDCWTDKLATLTDESITKLVPWASGKIKNRQLEVRDEHLAERVYQVEDACLENEDQK